MMNSGMLWAASVGFLLVMILLALLIRFLLKNLIKSQDQFPKLLKEVQQEKRVLLNLVMSKDVQSFSMLQAVSADSSKTSSDEYYPQSDQAELDRLAALAGNPMTGDDDLTQDSEFLDMVGQMNGLPDLDLSDER